VITTSNTVDGQPVIWLNGQSHQVIDASSNAGFVGVVNADNVTVRDLVLTASDPGVLFYNTTNSRVENVAVTGVGIGFMLENARHNTIRQCSATENEYGIWLRDEAFNTTLVGNTVRYNTLQGIYVYDAHNTTIRGNTVRNHYNSASTTISGIYLRMAHNTTIVDNVLSSNFFGIYLHALNEHTTIRGNVLTSSSDTGIKVYSSTRNVVDNNTVTAGKQGIYLTYGGDNTVTNNAIASTSSLGGLVLQSSTGNTLRHNHLTSNNIGIRLTYSSNNTLVDNVAEGSYYDGMWLQGSFNVVEDNNASWNGGGFGIRGDHNWVMGNVAAHNQDEGMSFYESNDNRITNNTLSHNTWGLWLSGSERNTLTNNTMTDNDQNFAVFGSSWEPFAFNHDIDASNLVDGRPIRYLVNASDVVVDASWIPGRVYVIHGVNVTVTGLNLTRNVDGIFLVNTTIGSPRARPASTCSPPTGTRSSTTPLSSASTG
jgi:parallel beta-helix repeat protein